MRRQGKARPAASTRSERAPTTPASTSLHRQGPGVQLLLEAAVHAHQSGQRADADRLYQQVLAHEPDQPDALHLLGVLAYQAGRADLAAALIERAIARRQDAAAFHLNLGNVLLALGRHTDGFVSYRRAIDLAPTDPVARFNFGSALVATGAVADGVEQLQQTVALAPGHIDAQVALGNALRTDGRLDDAVGSYQTAVALRPDLAPVWISLGLTLPRAEQGRHTDAADVLARLADLAPDDVQVHRGRVRELRAAGRSEDAVWAGIVGLGYCPADGQLVRGIVEILQTVPTAPFMPAVRDALLAACTDETFDTQLLAVPLINIIDTAPETEGLVAIARAG